MFNIEEDEKPKDKKIDEYDEDYDLNIIFVFDYDLFVELMTP